MNKMIVLCSTICMLFFAACDSNKLYDARDGKTYKTVTIGARTWMAENLNYSDSIAAPGLVGRSICPNNSAENCAKYGRLYTWAAAMDSAGTFSTDGKGCSFATRKEWHNCFKERRPIKRLRGICPEGWHLPSWDEWRTLFEITGNVYALQAKGFAKWRDATNASGFSALPAGMISIYRGKEVSIYDFNNSAELWMPSGDYALIGTGGTYLMPIGSGNFEQAQTFPKRRSVRCIKDDPQDKLY